MKDESHLDQKFVSFNRKRVALLLLERDGRLNHWAVFHCRVFKRDLDYSVFVIGWSGTLVRD